MIENNKILIKNLWDSGETIQSIVQMLPYDEFTCKRMIKELKNSGVLIKRKKENKNTTKEKVVNAYISGTTNPYKLAEMYGRSVGTIENILCNAHLNRKRPNKNYKERQKTQTNELTEKTQNIIEALKDGHSAKKISQMYGVSKQWVYMIKKTYIKGIKRRLYS